MTSGVSPVTLQCEKTKPKGALSGVVRPEGWHNWNFPEREKTVRYAEFGSTGSGAKPDARVAWARRLTKSEVKNMTPEKVLAGTDGWNPLTGKFRARS